MSEQREWHEIAAESLKEVEALRSQLAEREAENKRLREAGDARERSDRFLAWLRWLGSGTPEAKRARADASLARVIHAATELVAALQAEQEAE